jgi:hypothetical protein
MSTQRIDYYDSPEAPRAMDRSMRIRINDFLSRSGSPVIT